jgi:hypothetical protein
MKINRYKVIIDKDDNGERLVILTTGSSVQSVEDLIMDTYQYPRRVVYVLKTGSVL